MDVDTQKDFMNPDGALYVKGAESIKPNLKKLTDFARENNIMVVNTCDSHEEGDKELSDKPDFMTTFPKHCMVDSKGMEFIKETKPDEFSEIYHGNISRNELNFDYKDVVIYKDKFDVFEGNSHTDRFLDLINPDIVVVYGVATNVCVNCAVQGLLKRGIRVLVVEDGIKELPNLPLEDIFKGWGFDSTRLSLKELIEHLEFELKIGNYKI